MGRKKSDRERTPSGQLSRAQASLPQTRANVLRVAAFDQRFASPAGHAFISGELSASQYERAQEVAGIMAAYHKAIGVKGIASPSVEQGRGAAPVDPDTDAGRAEAERDAKAVRAFERLRDRLLWRGKAIFDATIKFCEGQHCDWQEREWAKVGLSQLAMDASGRKSTCGAKTQKGPAAAMSDDGASIASDGDQPGSACDPA